MTKDEWELFILSKSWWLNHANGLMMSSIYGTVLSMSWNEMYLIELKHNKRFHVILGG